LTSVSPSDLERLEVIRELIDRLDRQVAGRTRDEFVDDRDQVDLAAYRLGSIGENCRRLSDDLKARNPDLPWRAMYALRNVVAHEYQQIKPDRIWVAVRSGLGAVRDMADAEIARAPAEEPGRER
jgi:uncharacterized protein with HEPN domain